MTNKSTRLVKSSTDLRWQSFVPWMLAGVVTVLAGIVWGDSFGWRLSELSIYQLFPVFGLVAFSVMWSHYMADFLHKTLLKHADLDLYFKVTSFVVLLAILLHPGLLAYQRFRDGFGLPLGSLTGYVVPSIRWIVLLGTVSFLAFMAFELHRWFGEKSWWKYVLYANDAAMIAIFYHGLRLGSQLHGNWYQVIWYFYGLTLIGVIIFKYYQAFLRKKFHPAITTNI